MPRSSRGKQYKKRKWPERWPKIEHTPEKEPKIGTGRHFKPKYHYKKSGKPVPGEKKGIHRYVGKDLTSDGWLPDKILKKWRKK
jgi:hypothetical protein